MSPVLFVVLFLCLVFASPRKETSVKIVCANLKKMIIKNLAAFNLKKKQNKQYSRKTEQEDGYQLHYPSAGRVDGRVEVAHKLRNTNKHIKNEQHLWRNTK